LKAGACVTAERALSASNFRHTGSCRGRALARDGFHRDLADDVRWKSGVGCEMMGPSKSALQKSDG